MPASAPTGRDLLLRGRTFAPGKTGLLAIINRTPDSFYDQGMFLDDDVALEAVERAVAEGADIVDIGGVKAGPGAEVSAAEELARVVPFVEEVRAALPGAVISVDTWRARGGRRGVRGRGGPAQRRLGRGTTRRLAEVAAGRGAAACAPTPAAHAPRTDPHRVRYDDVVGRRAVDDLLGQAERALAAGVPRGRPADRPGPRLRQEHLALAGADRGRLGELVGPAGRCWSRCPTRTSSARRSACR